jgi:serine protease Do
MSTVPQQYVSQGYPAGVLVSEVVKGSPAEKAGLKAQDIITAVSGRTVKSGEALRAVLDSCEAGTTVTLTVQRPSGKTYQEIEVKVTLGRYQDIDFDSVEESTTEAPTEDEYDLDDILKEFFGH